jgi:hypothetical protein
MDLRRMASFVVDPGKGASAMKRLPLALALLAVPALVAAGCGGGSSKSTSSNSTTKTWHKEDGAWHDPGRLDRAHAVPV